MVGRLLVALILAAGLACTAHATCFQDAAQRYGIDADLLKAIAVTESKMNPAAIGANANGSQDFGVMQINSSWLPTLRKFGIGKKELMNPCVSVNIGAWILANNFVQHGKTWKAVGAYNAATPWKRNEYIKKVQYALQQLRATGPRNSLTS